MRPLLAVSGLGKSFGALRAVDGVSFSVPRGAIYGIAGPNGSGKSTLFNLLTCAGMKADRGAATFDGEPVHNRSPHAVAKLGLARTFQRDAEFATLSVLDNALVGAANGPARRLTAAQDPPPPTAPLHHLGPPRTAPPPRPRSIASASVPARIVAGRPPCRAMSAAA